MKVEPPRPPAGSHGGSLRADLRTFAEFFAICGVVFAQPLFDLLSDNAGLFVELGTTRSQAIAFVLLVLLAPPILCSAVVAAARRRAAWHPWVYGSLAALVLFVGVFEAARTQTTASGAGLFAGAAAGALGFAVLATRVGAIRQWLRYLAVAPVVFALLFLFASPVTDVVFASRGGVAGARARIERPDRIVLVVFDELPAKSLLDGSGRIDRELFPNFAALADSSTWFRNVTTVSPYTPFAVPAVLTGRHPRERDAQPIAADYPESIFTLLAGTYEVNGHETITRVCPTPVCGRSSRGFAGLTAEAWRLWGDFASPNPSDLSFGVNLGLERALSHPTTFTESLAPAEKPRFDFAHVLLPHFPWHYIGTLQDTKAPRELPGAQFLGWADSDFAAAGRQRHLLQTQATDAVLGRIIDRLKRLGAFDNSLVVVTADHGISFTDGELLRGVSKENYTEVMWAPLFVKLPGQQRGQVDDRPGSTIDVVPTIADVIDARVPWEVDGVSLLGAPRSEGARRLYPWSSGLRGEPERAPQPPPGHDFLEFDGRAGFREVLRARAAPPGDPALRIYRDRDFGELVGRPVAPLVADEPGPAIASIEDVHKFDDVDPHAESIPWAYNEGWVNNLDRTRSIAVANHGIVIAVSRAVLIGTGGNGFFTFVVPPALVEPGRNDLSMYLIGDSEAAPTLDPITLRR
jgi:hypothetical protein